MALTVVSGPILARLIGPAAYGVVAPAQSVGSLGKLLAESGFAYHTVTARSINANEARDLNSQSLSLSLYIAVLAAVAVSFYEGSTVDRIDRAALTFALVLLTGAAAVPVAWAQRNGHLARLEWWGVPSQALITFGIAIPCAFFGFRLLAVNATVILPVLLALGIAWRVSGLATSRPTPTKIATSYRLGSLSSNLGSYLGANVDTLMLATYLSVGALGVYSRANMLASIPGTIVSASVARVGLVSLSKSELWQDHRKFLIKATALTIFVFSALAVIAGLGVDLTSIAFGKAFSTPPLGFATLVASQIFFYGGSLLDTYLTVRRKLAVVGLSHTVQAGLSAVGFLIWRPTSILVIALILMIPSAVRYLCVLALINYQRFDTNNPSTVESEPE